MNLELQHWQHTKVASRGSSNHGGLLRRSSLVNELFATLDILLLLRTREIMLPGSVLQAESTQAPGCCILLALFSKNKFPLPPQPSLILITTVLPLVHLSLPCTHWSTSPSLSPLYYLFVHSIGIENCSVSYSLLFCLNSFTSKYTVQRIVHLIQGF